MIWNSEQNRLIAPERGQFRIYGGPGTGKTELAVHKAASIYLKSRSKVKIILLTRSKWDIQTLEHKLFRLLGNNPIEVTTFHSLARKTLQKKSFPLSDFGHRILTIDLLKNFPFKKSILCRVSGSLHLIGEICGLVNLFRWNLIKPDDLPDIPGDSLLEELKLLYRLLEERIQESGFISETGIYEAAAESNLQSYDAVFVEETQDITLPQYLLLKSIARRSSFLALLGDPYRNIYRFQGSDPDIMRNIVDVDFPGIETIYLKVSYRLNTAQVECAANMFDEEAKSFLASEGSDDAPIYYAEFSSPGAESTAVASTIERLIRLEGFAPEETAIILRSPGVHGARFRHALAFKEIPVNGGIAPCLTPSVKKLLETVAEADDRVIFENGLRDIILKIAAEFPNDEISLKGLSAAVKLLEEAYSILPDYSPSGISALAKEEFLQRPFIEETGGVSIISIHSARGKFYRVVFLPGLVENSFPAEVEQRFIFPYQWMEKLRGRLSKRLSYIERADLDKHLNEERRLFYTAMSLPTEKLYLSRPLMEQGEELNSSLFLYETGIISEDSKGWLSNWGQESAQPLSIENTIEAEAIRAMIDLSETEREDFIKKMERELGEKIDIDFIFSSLQREKAIQTPPPKLQHLSAGAINTYLSCPRRFYFQYVLRLPAPSTPAMIAGMILHRVLERLHRELGFLNAERSKDALNDLLNEIIDAESSLEAGSTDEIILRRYLLEKLINYLDTPDAYGGEVMELEKVFAWDPEPGLIFTGRIDRIDRTPNGVELIDYKSSGTRKHKALATRFLDITHKEADMQLPLYFAAAEGALGMNVEYISLLPLEYKGGAPLRITFEISPDKTKVSILSRKMLDSIRTDIIALAKEIHNAQEFLRGSNAQCRNKFTGIICPFIHICDIAE